MITFVFQLLLLFLFFLRVTFFTWFGIMIYGFVVRGDLICSLWFSLSLFSPANADSCLSGYVVAITEFESLSLSTYCNGGVCSWPRYTIRESIKLVPELGGSLLASWSWHWIYIALPTEYLGAGLFCLLSQAVCVSVGGMPGEIYPLGLSSDSAPALACQGSWSPGYHGFGLGLRCQSCSCFEIAVLFLIH